MAALQRVVRASSPEALCLSLLRSSCPPVQRFAAPCRRYATHGNLGSASKSSTRRQVTVANDDGRVRWGELSTGEKVARSTQQSFNFLVVIAGIVATGAVVYVIYSEVISPESTTNQYHRALNRIKGNPKCVELLGNPKKIIAYGERPYSRMARQWSITSRKEKDRAGNDHLHVRFYVEGPLNKGTVHLHMKRPPGAPEYDYETLALDIPGHKRIFLEDADDSWSPLKKKSGKLFGVRWW